MAAKKTTSSVKKTQTKKPAKKTAVKKVETKGKYLNTDEDSLMKIRFFLIVIALVIIGAFNLPIGQLYGETNSGSIIIENLINGDYAGIASYMWAIFVPVLLCSLALIMLIIKLDRFTSVLAIMFTGVGIFFQLVFCGYLGTLEIGWYAILCAEIIEFVYSIALFVSLPSMKKNFK